MPLTSERSSSSSSTRHGSAEVFLHLSQEEQLARFQERLGDPAKRWKFRSGDLDTRARWTTTPPAYEEAITETSTDWAPWHVVPADRKWVRNLAVAELLVEMLRRLDPQPPEPEQERRTPESDHSGRR